MSKQVSLSSGSPSNKLIEPQEGVVGTSDLRPVNQKYRLQAGLATGILTWKDHQSLRSVAGQKHSNNLWLVSEVEGGLVGLSPLSMESDPISGQTVSEMSWTSVYLPASKNWLLMWGSLHSHTLELGPGTRLNQAKKKTCLLLHQSIWNGTANSSWKIIMESMKKSHRLLSLNSMTL